MRVAVTGASGNAGTSVLDALAADDSIESILAIARRRPARTWPKTEWLRADVAQANLEVQLRGADALVHLAWLIQPSRDERVTRATNVEGSARTFEAAARAGVGAIVYASSVGVYGPGPKDRAVDESWPATGIATSFYSRHKAAVERALDTFERDHPEIRVVRLRPGLIFKRAAASGIRRLFAGPLLPSALVQRRFVPVLPAPPRLRFQAVHSLDVGQAYRLAVTRQVRGPFNIAAEPILDPAVLARALDARPIRMPAAALRAIVDLTWRARLQPTSPGWMDMALGVPIMDVSRAREELGWEPRRSSVEAFLELFEGLHERAGLATPPLDPVAGGPARIREILTRVGGSSR
jgi:nucleoside-diphosphate-sugar epimerase